MLSWEEVRRMNKAGITFGAHTVTHPVLAGIPLERIEAEVSGSKKTIEQRLQAPARHFAYPFGKPSDVGPLAKQVVQNAGFETAVTTVIGLNGPEEDRFELKRYSITDPDVGMFALKLDWYRTKLMPGSVPPQPIFNKPLYREASSRS
jgi:peptidoglycan/xylan/chitin deacetylase (PgdA/CDA1 family)